MHLTTLLSALSASVALASGIANPPHVIHETRDTSLDANNHVRADGDAIFTLKIGLQQSNLDRGELFLMDTSLPTSQFYGKHWSAQQVIDIFSPSIETRETVLKWLADSGFGSVIYQNGWLALDVTVRQAETLLNTTYFEEYAHGSQNESVRLWCNEYSLPANISQLVDYISPGVASSTSLAKRKVPHLQRRASSRHNTGWWTHKGLLHSGTTSEDQEDLQNCWRVLTPACLRALYHLPDPSSVAQNFSSEASSGTVGVFEALDYYNQSDLDAWFAKYAAHVPSGTHPILRSVDGGIIDQTAPQAERVESNIDIDIFYSLLYPKVLTLYQVAGKAAQNATTDTQLSIGMDNLFNAIDGSFCTEQDKRLGLDCGTIPSSKVMSISYGSGELYLTVKQQRRQCHEFMKLALQGHTFVVASGDWGVADMWRTSADGVLTNGCGIPSNSTATDFHASNGTLFHPSFPANCPYVLTVGGTMIRENGSVHHEEEVMHQPLDEAIELTEEGVQSLYPTTTSSGGGFSNYFCRPLYQESALGAYFTKHTPKYPSYIANGLDMGHLDSNIGSDNGLFNRAGRGIPDVSANGANYPVVAAGQTGPVWGTSLSTPVWASILTLINEKRGSVGKGPVGFVQPVLYSHPEVFHDITEGNNPGCGTRGFSAVSGWDPLTGLGTPNFPKLLELFMNLP